MSYMFAGVQWETPDDGQRKCLKHVEFYSKNDFKNSVHLVALIIRIYHDARSPERQTKYWYLNIQFYSVPLKHYLLRYGIASNSRFISTVFMRMATIMISRNMSLK